MSDDSPAQNLVEAASNGAIAAIKVVSSVAANLIAILGLIAFLNKVLYYLGSCVGVPELSFKVRTTERNITIAGALSDVTYVQISDIQPQNHVTGEKKKGGEEDQESVEWAGR